MSAPTAVHPSAFVGPGVELGVGVVVGPLAVLLGPTTIGDFVRIGPGAHVGGAPEIASVRQNNAWDGDLDHHEIRIGTHTNLRDGVVVHHGSRRPTLIGASCQLFSRAYVAHDVQVGDGVTLSGGVSVGGHATIGDGANLGMNACVHQFRSIGPGAMVGMGTPVTRDLPPFSLVFGTPPRLHGVNRVGMTRAGVPEATIERVEVWLMAGAAPEAREVLDVDDVTGVVGAALAWWRDLPERDSVTVAARAQS